MKRKIALLLMFLFLFNNCAVVFATDDEEVTEENICATGSLEMELEELSVFLSELPMIVDVKPNQLYNERLSEELNIIDENLSGSSLNVMADGDEIVTNTYNIPSTLTVDEISYPSKVDNSAETTFPVIKDQGYINSCLGWSLAYYQLTNNANKIRGTAARNGTSNINSRVYSPNWVYNLGNWGDNSGMHSNRALNVLYTYGCPSISDVSIKTSKSTASNYLSWYPTASIWGNALYNKCDVYYGTVNPNNLDTPITAPDSQYLDNIKKLLADGYVVTIETYVNPSSDNYLPVTKTGRTSENTSAYVWTEVRNVSDGGHAVTIVGYDDNFKVDINGNGSYQTGEYGAFKIANSWGKKVSKHNNGYVWLSYDALNAVSSVKTSVHSKRVPAFRNESSFYFIKPQKEYKPLLTAEVDIKTGCRDKITVYLGIVDNEDEDNYYEKRVTTNDIVKDLPDVPTNFIAFGSGYGAYNLSGTNSQSTGTVVFDITSLLQEFELENNHSYNVYLKVKDSSKTAEISSLILKDHKTNTTYESEDTPISMDSSTVFVNVAYVSSIMSAINDKSFKLNFNSKIDEATLDDTIITLTNSNEDYFSLDLSLSDDEETVILNKQGGTYVNDFYTISISPELRSKGGNHLPATINYPFYIPFH